MWPTYYVSLTQRTWQWTMQQSLLATQAELFLTTKDSLKETGLIQMRRKMFFPLVMNSLTSVNVCKNGLINNL
jgi:hypothetical protein